MTPNAADVEAFLAHGSVLRGEFRWHQVGRHNWRAEAWLEDTYEGAKVKIVGTYNSRIRNLSYALIWAGCRIRGLDVNGPGHRNPDGEWLETPHKHRWTDRDRDRWAYFPDDIVSTDRRGIFLEFLNESNIRFEATYVDAYLQGELLP